MNRADLVARGPMRLACLFLTLLAAGLGFTACPPPTNPGQPGGAGQGGVLGPAGGPGAAGAPQGGQGGYAPAGAGGAPYAETPLCPLEREGESDDDLDKVRLELGTALIKLKWGNLETVKRAWLTYREEPSRTVIIIVPPTGPGWTAAEVPGGLEQVRAQLTGGYVSLPKEGCATCGFRSPCPDVPGRVAGIGRDVPYTLRKR